LHHLSRTATTYNLTISTAETEILTLLKGKELISNKVIIKNKIIEQVTNFNLAVNLAVTQVMICKINYKDLITYAEPSNKDYLTKLNNRQS
jgi:hypothetical protein